MLKWILLTGVVLLIGLIGLVLLLKNGTLYQSGDWGFVAWTGTEERVHHTGKAGLEKVATRLLKGDIYDLVWISQTPNKYTGLVLTLEEKIPTLSVTFKTEKQHDELVAFREVMRAYKLEAKESAQKMLFSEPETELEFALKREPTQIVEAVVAALSQLQGDMRDGYYLTASLFAHGPGGKEGTHFSRQKIHLARFYRAGVFRIQQQRMVHVSAIANTL